MRIAIDPNIRKEHGWTYAAFSDVFGEVSELKPDDWVTAMWSETDQIFDSKVVSIDFERKLVYLAVDWDSVRSDHVPRVIGTVTITSGGRTRIERLGA